MFGKEDRLSQLPIRFEYVGRDSLRACFRRCKGIIISNYNFAGPFGVLSLRPFQYRKRI